MNETDIEKLAQDLKRYLLHAAYGRAVLESHSLENSLVILLATKIVDGNHNFDSQLDKLKKLTLGRLIERTLKEFEISKYWQEELDNVLWFRNRLIHNISEDVSSKILNHGDIYEVIIELSDIYGYFYATNKYIEELTFSWLNEKGYDKDRILVMVRKLIKRDNNKSILPQQLKPDDEKEMCDLASRNEQ